MKLERRKFVLGLLERLWLVKSFVLVLATRYDLLNVSLEFLRVRFN